MFLDLLRSSQGAKLLRVKGLVTSRRIRTIRS